MSVLKINQEIIYLITFLHLKVHVLIQMLLIAQATRLKVFVSPSLVTILNYAEKVAITAVMKIRTEKCTALLIMEILIMVTSIA